ncbi:MAG: SMP-30/gluconolactonase/LRE family protein [Janthinobacterium lividum]
MYFQAPPQRNAEVFTALPEALKSGGPQSSWNRVRAAGKTHSSFLEGPSFDRAGNLWCVDGVNGRIYKITPNGEFEVVVEYQGWPNGLKIHADGRIYVADYMHGIMCLDPLARVIHPFLVNFGGEHLKGVNDLFFARNGDLYFTDQGATGLQDPTGRLFRYSADGVLSRLLDNVPSPNGLVMNLQENVLYLAVTRANGIWRVAFDARHQVTKVGLFIQLSGGIGPDGLALDQQDRLYVAHAGLGSVWVFDQNGEPVQRIRTPQGLESSNLAFGGADNRELYITESESASLCRITLDVPGKPMYSHSHRASR